MFLAILQIRFICIFGFVMFEMFIWFIQFRSPNSVFAMFGWPPRGHHDRSENAELGELDLSIRFGYFCGGDSGEAD